MKYETFFDFPIKVEQKKFIGDSHVRHRVIDTKVRIFVFHKEQIQIKG